MKTDDINQVLEFNQKFPTRGEYLIDTLMESHNWLTLEYDVIILLNDVFNCGYNPTAVSELFKNK
jgi:hypothetical protein